MFKRSIVSRIPGFLGLPGDLQTLWNILGLSTVFSTVTGVLDYWLGTGQIGWAILIGFGVFAFATHGFNQIVNSYRSSTVFRHIMVRRHEPVDGEIQTNSGTMYLTIGTVLENTSSRQIFFKVQRASLSLQGRVNQEGALHSETAIIPPNSHKFLRHATITDLKTSERVDGNIQLEVLYGPTGDSLRYKFIYEGSPSLIQRWDGKQDAGGIPATILCAEKRADHEKLGWI